MNEWIVNLGECYLSECCLSLTQIWTVQVNVFGKKIIQFNLLKEKMIISLANLHTDIHTLKYSQSTL